MKQQQHLHILEPVVSTRKHSYDPARTFQEESNEDGRDAATPQKRRGRKCNDEQEGRAIQQHARQIEAKVLFMTPWSTALTWAITLCLLTTCPLKTPRLSSCASLLAVCHASRSVGSLFPPKSLHSWLKSWPRMTVLVGESHSRRPAPEEMKGTGGEQGVAVMA